MFRAQSLLVHEWRKFPFLDPDLPGGDAPAGWPRSRAHDVFHERHALWHAPAQDYFALARGAQASAPAPDSPGGVAGSSKSSRSASK